MMNSISIQSSRPANALSSSVSEFTGDKSNNIDNVVLVNGPSSNSDETVSSRRSIYAKYSIRSPVCSYL